ncbi:hypothetical protein KTH81_00305 [Lachnospiraceae bacterium ASD3451]|uniref:rhamnulokinase n=1 Tax=Diplocloster agilis TaxID=2850323 RepID=UPI001D37C299|nr:FGGY-family carbohydrate kinase [Diplocloster agilis]MBU9742246.1 hypothetical protein [Diplocloster agilis]
MAGKHLAVDLGSSNGKIVLVELAEDKKVKLEEIHRFLTPRSYIQGHLSTDIYGIYDEIIKALQILKKENIRIDSMGVDSWSSDFGIVNAYGIPEGLPVFYRDKRTLGMEQYISKKISYEDLYPLTTQRKIPESSLGQLLAIEREHPGSLADGRRIMFLGDLLMYLFSGRICSEYTVASYSQLYSMKKQEWEKRVFQLFDLPESLMTQIVHPGEVLGSIDTKQARFYDIDPVKIIAPAVHDTASAVAAIPATSLPMGKKTWAFLSTGTWFLAGMETDEPKNLEACYQYNMSNTGLAFHKNMVKRNICAMWLLQECKRIWDKNGLHYEYAQIAAIAEKAVPFLAMLNTEDESFFHPKDMPHAIAEFLIRTGQTRVREDDVGQIARIVYESVAFQCAYSIRALEEISGQQIDHVYIVGGAGRIDFLNQLIATSSQKKLITGPIEASAMGNGLLQAYGCKEITSLQELRDIVKCTESCKTYQPEEWGIWAEMYTKYLRLCGLE